MFELWLRYKDWIDDSIFDGIDDEDIDAQDAIIEQIQEKYCMGCVLRPDAPKDAKDAWEEESRLRKQARAEGIMID